MPDFMDAQEGDEGSIEVVDVRVSVENSIQRSSNFSTTKKPVLLVKDLLETEKHISVDPFSLRETTPNLQPEMFPVTTPARKADHAFRLPPLRPPTKPRFLSYSLPNSASSSPRFTSRMPSMNLRNMNQVPPVSVNSCLRQDSIALANLERLREAHIRRSKSCGEGRTSAPPEELDLLMVKASLKGDYRRRHNKVDNLSKAEVQMDELAVESCDDKVKCGALCLFIPGFGKGAKPVRARKEEAKEMKHFQEPRDNNLELIVSKRVSLEKFECGSWSSSVILDDLENQKDVSNLYFDLPLEMIHCSSSSDTNLPVTTAFVFDKDRKGVLKKSSSRTTPKRSPDPSRHVRFSSSSPTSSPSLASRTSFDDPLEKAREDFNSFLAMKYL